MKKSTLVLFFVFAFMTVINAQITSVKYLLEYNESTALYDVKLVIEEGSATTIPQRVQFNSQVSIVVPTGSTILIAESFNPIEDNANYTGIMPSEWIMGTGINSPPTQPENDFYNIYPNLVPIGSYNDLFAGDAITLFNLDINVDPCENSVRLFENGIDPSQSEMPDGIDYSNFFTIGGINPTYNGNLSSYYANSWDITLEDYEICADGCVELVPSLNCSTDDLTYNWNTGEDTPTITVCPDVITTYTVEITAPNSDMMNLESVVSIASGPEVSLNGPNNICVGGNTFSEPSTGGTWVSSDDAVATVTNTGVVTGVNTGIAIITYIDSITGCTSEGIQIDVIGLPIAIITGPDSICVNGSTTLEPNSGGTWVSDNPAIATVDNFGNVTGVSPGFVTFTFTNAITGCSSLPSEFVWVFDNLSVSFTGLDLLCVNETTTVSPDNGNSGGTWESNNTEIATIDANTGVVTAVSSGQTTFIYTSILGCSAVTTALTVVPLPNISIDESEICVGSTTNVMPTSGGTWTISDPNIASISIDGTLEGLSEGMVTLTFTDNTTGCSSIGLDVSIVSTPTLIYTGPDTICVGDMTTISPSSGGLWALSYTNSTSGVVASIDNNGNISGLEEGKAVFTFISNATGCGSSVSDTLWVYALPEVAFIGEDRLCKGACSFVSPTSGGTWASNNSSVATIDPITGKITGIGQGLCTFTFTDSISGCSSTTTGFIVDPVPTAAIDFDSICMASTALLSPVIGGTWEALNPEIATLNTNVVTGLSVGDAGFLFTSDATGCISDTVFINIGAQSSTTLNGPNEICVGETTNILPSSGGSWSSSDPNIATVDNFGNITGVGSGEVIFTFTDSQSLCISAPSEPVTVLSNPFQNIANPIETCLGLIIAISPSPNGTWESNNPDVASVNSNGIITSVSAGTAVITFTDSITGCPTELEIIIYENVEIDFDGVNEICIGDSTLVSSSTEGTWLTGDPNIATVDNLGNVIGIASGTTTIEFIPDIGICLPDGLVVSVLPQSDPSCIVGIDDLNAIDFKIYPNPAKDIFHIESESSIETVAIYSASFQKIKSILFPPQKRTIQMSTDGLNAGLYYIAIKAEGNIIYKKLIIE